MKILVPMTLISFLMTFISIVLVVIFYNWTVTIILCVSALLSIVGMIGLIICEVKGY